MNRMSFSTHRICLVAIYLGRLPGWLPVWLRSCEMNPEIDFLLLSDRPWDVPFCPNNVKVEATALAELKDRFSTAAGFTVALNHAYKICDFKPAFGEALSDLLGNYDFWGHTDLDLFYGNLVSFIPQEALRKCVRLYHRGHLSIFRNDREGNSLYKLHHPDIDWREAFRRDSYEHFDEYLGIERLVQFHKIPEFENNYAFADILPHFSRLRLSRNELNHRNQAFSWKNGVAQQIYFQDGYIHTRDFMYVHLQKRKMPDINPMLWQKVVSWVLTPQGFVAGAPRVWTASDIQRFDQPNYGHTLSYAWKRAKRRFVRPERLKTS